MFALSKDRQKLETFPASTIAVHYDTALRDLVAAGKYDWVNRDITAANFTVEGIGMKRFRCKLFHPNRPVSSVNAVAAIKDEKFVPGGHEHGLAFGDAYPDLQRKYPIACLGSSVQVDGRRHIMCLDGAEAGRGLDLYFWDVDWYDYWRFLGVQEASEP